MDLSNSSILVIGTGSIGMRHARVLRDAGFSVSLMTSNQDQCRALKSTGWNVHLRTEEGNFKNCTHAIVASRTRSHVGDALACIEQNIPVLIEKPLAATVEEASPLLAAVSKSQEAQVYCGYTLRFSRSLQRLAGLLPEIGEPHAATVQCRSFLPDWRPESDHRASYSADLIEGGVLRDLSHEIDYAGWLLGWPSEVYAALGNTGRLGIEADEVATISYNTENGCQVNIGIDYLSRPPIRQLTIFASEGTLSWNAIQGQVVRQLSRADVEVEELPQDRDTMLLEQDLAFLEGGRLPLPGIREAVHTLSVCDAARNSSETRRAQPVVPSL